MKLLINQYDSGKMWLHIWRCKSETHVSSSRGL